jgi:HlyD family secretion protein
VAAGASALALLAAGGYFWRPATADSASTVVVRRGPLVATLSVPGVLTPAQSITYRSPLGPRETLISFLVDEGTRVGEGDLLVRLDTTELERELERSRQELRQAQVDFQVADIEKQEGEAAVQSLADGEGALTLDEARGRLQTVEKKVARLRADHERLKPLLDRGFLTREELSKTSDALEAAEEELALARRRTGVLVEQTFPRDQRRAELQLAQRAAQRENVRARLQDAEARVTLLMEQIEGCSLYASQAGLVVYEEHLGTSPRRKIRAGDRVSGSQGLVTIPEVDRMLVRASVSEADVHRVQAGLKTLIALEAFPGVSLTGQVARVGALAGSAGDRPIDEKRFDLIVAMDATAVEVRPEMTARVDVIIAELPDALLVPINAVFDRDGAPVVHVVEGGGGSTRAVRLGLTSSTSAQVVDGVREGERVALVDRAGSAVVAESPADAVTNPAPVGAAKRRAGGGR